jgi:hypothetical protein
MIHRILCAALLGLLAASSAPAKTIRTAETELAKFQDVIEKAAYGDTVLVAPGTYPSVMLRPGIRLVSEKGPESTTLRGDRNFVVSAKDCDTLNVVDGFTLDGVRACESIVLVEEGPLVVKNCVLKHGWSGVRVEHGTVRAEKLRVTDCQFGFYFNESKGDVLESDVRRCVTGVHLINSSPRILRSTITGNSLGIDVTEHSDPQIGGSVAGANRIYGNPGGAIKNRAYAKEDVLRTTKLLVLRVPYNYWGSNCPDSLIFRGSVVWAPWVDETAKKSFERCAPAAAKKP